MTCESWVPLAQYEEPFFIKSKKMYGEYNFASGAKLAASARAVRTFEIICTVFPRSGPVQYEQEHFRVFA